MVTRRQQTLQQIHLTLLNKSVLFFLQYVYLTFFGGVVFIHSFFLHSVAITRNTLHLIESKPGERVMFTARVAETAARLLLPSDNSAPFPSLLHTQVCFYIPVGPCIDFHSFSLHLYRLTLAIYFKTNHPEKHPSKTYLT